MENHFLWFKASMFQRYSWAIKIIIGNQEKNDTEFHQYLQANYCESSHILYTWKIVFYRKTDKNVVQVHHD